MTEKATVLVTELLVEREDCAALVLRQPGRAGSLVGAITGLAIAGVCRLLFPQLSVAPLLFLLFAAGCLSGLLKNHELSLDFRSRSWRYRRGWVFSAPRAEGSFDSLLHVSIKPHTALDGLVVSRLRSRALWLVSRDGWSFRLGPPMGPRVAEERATTLAKLLSLPVEALQALDQTGSDALQRPETTQAPTSPRQGDS